MKKVLFAGCSYTAGIGFDLEKKDPRLWVNLLHQNSRLKDLELNNCARGGRSNAGIFQDAVFHISQGHTAVAFVCWTSVPRYEMELGVETYATRAVFFPNGSMIDHNLNDIQYSKAYLERIRDRFTALAHPHHEIVNVICYVNALIRLCQLTGTQIYFINSMCPWDQDYFVKLNNVLPDSYTDFTKKILNVETRNDKEVFEIYNQIHNDYNNYGGIQTTYWLSVYNSLRNQLIDYNNDGMHPGSQSNQLYFNQLVKLVNQQ
jgi:hypothetical protein